MKIEHFVNYGTINEVNEGAVQNIYINDSRAHAAVPDKEKHFKTAVKAMVEKNIIHKKAEWAAVKRVLEDKRIYDNLQYTTFVRMLADADVPADVLPTDSTLGKVIFKNRPFPSWEIEDRQPDAVRRFVHIADLFMQEFER